MTKPRRHDDVISTKRQKIFVPHNMRIVISFDFDIRANFFWGGFLGTMISDVRDYDIDNFCFLTL